MEKITTSSPTQVGSGIGVWYGSTTVYDGDDNILLSSNSMAVALYQQYTQIYIPNQIRIDNYYTNTKYITTYDDAVYVNGTYQAPNTTQSYSIVSNVLCTVTKA